MFLSAILAGFLLVSCNKELGYTGFVDPDAGKNAEISLATDKAAYAPGETENRPQLVPPGPGLPPTRISPGIS